MRKTENTRMRVRLYFYMRKGKIGMFVEYEDLSLERQDFELEHFDIDEMHY